MFDYVIKQIANGLATDAAVDTRVLLAGENDELVQAQDSHHRYEQQWGNKDNQEGWEKVDHNVGLIGEVLHVVLDQGALE